MEYGKLKDFINGQWVSYSPEEVEWKEVYNPSTGKEIAEVPTTPDNQIEAAIDAAAEAHKTWKNVSLEKRMKYLFDLRNAFINHHEELAFSIAVDQAKHIADARGEVNRTIQIIETACGIPTMITGNKFPINDKINGEVIRESIGVVGVLSPFNFPCLVFGWFVPFAIGCGNTVVFKASSQSPLFMQKVMGIVEEIDLPKGVLNLVNGSRKVVSALLESPKIQAMSFVGSTPVGQIVAEGCAKTAKRGAIFAGAKNTAVVMEDANMGGFIQNYLNSAYGNAGQRCMALSIVVAVEEIYEQVKERMVEASKEVLIGDSTDENIFLGPVISAKSKQNCHKYIELSLEQGANLALDGRNPKLPEKNKEGFFVGPTILSEVTPDMSIAIDEIFGPVIALMKVKDIDEAIEFINSSEFGNGGSIFTESGAYAHQFLRDVDSGMLGVNVGVPASMPYLPFGGTKASMFGSEIKVQGQDSVEFFTKKKAATVRFYGKEDLGKLKAESGCLAK